MLNRYLDPHRVLGRGLMLLVALLGTLAPLAAQTTAPTVLAPNGGERYEMTDPIVVRFSAPYARAVRVEFSPNGGRFWIVLDTAVDASLGTLTFTPGYPTPFGLVRVIDVDRPELLDRSDGTFTVLEAPSIAIYSPAEQDRVIRGSTHVITWLAGRIARVHIEYSPSGGTPGSWQRIASFVDARKGYFEWAVPTTLTAAGKIRILDADGPTIGETGLFSIIDPPSQQPWVRLLVPNGGEVYTQGDIITVSWAASRPTSDITILLSSDGGATWRQLVRRSVGPPVTSLPVAIDRQEWPAGRNYRVRVVTEAGADESDASFELRRLLEPRITVVHPNGGEVIESDSTVEVTWSATDVSGLVDVEYSLDAGATWRPIGTVDALAGLIRWDVPDTTSTRALVRVTGGPIGDTSDAVFWIIEPEADAWIEITSPNEASDEWSEGNIATIAWRSAGVTRVDIALSTDGGASWGRTIAQGIDAATGRFDYRVPHLADTVLTSLLVRVNAAGASAPFDYSNATYRYRPTIAAIAGASRAATLLIAPNPAATTARIAWRDAARELRLYDARGGLVRVIALDLESRSTTMDLEALPAGPYVIELRGGAGIERGRLVVR